MRPAIRPSLFVCALLVAVAFVFARPAFAQSQSEGQARALEKKAMEEDYLTLDFDKATQKLSQAISKCGGDKCSAQVRANLRRDLATVQAAAGKKDEAVATMTEALRIAPGLTLDPNFKTKELETILAEARKGVAAGGGAGGGGSHGAPSGDFTHTPVSEQLVRTPVPVYAEYGGSEQVEKVVVKYKGFGMTEFKTLEIKKIGNGWGGTIPCADAQAGDMQYYLQGFNAQNDPVATGGDRNNPYRVPVKRQISGEAAHLPGQPVPKQCAETGDCPPDFPGCKGGGDAANAGGPAAEEEPTGKGGGEECEEDTECQSGTCKDSKCTVPPERKTKGGRFKRIWVGIDASIDFALVPSSNNVCLLNPGTAAPVNSAGYYCTSGSTNFPLRPPPVDNDKMGLQNSTIIPGRNDKVSGGFTPANVRIGLSGDYAITPNFMAGIRFALVLNRYSGSAAANDGVGFHVPIFLEARGTYIIGKDALMTNGFKPYVYLGAGFGEIDAPVSVTVLGCSVPVVNGGCSGSTQSRGVTAWKIGGPGFAALGGGIRIGLGKKDEPQRYAIVGGLRLMGAFGNGFLFIPALPEIGAQIGF